MNAEAKHCELLVVGGGLAGMAASLFAANRGISTTLIGNTGGMRFYSGLMDLMAVHPLSTGKVWDNPWAAIENLAADYEQRHPYARIRPDVIRQSLQEYLAFLSDAGLEYNTAEDRNQAVMTAIGTVKPAFGLPRSMSAGVRALQRKHACLLVGLREMKGYSACQIRESMQEVWPSLRSVDINFPGSFHELFPEQAAKALEEEACRSQLARIIRPHLQGAESVGLPAVLGIRHHRAVHTDLETRLGVPVFEIPTLPPSIPGLRLKLAFQEQLVRKGVDTMFQQRIDTVVRRDAGIFMVDVGDGLDSFRIHAGALVLATGRFFSQGLCADRSGIREPLLGLPVFQPAKRADWHQMEFLAGTGHAVNTAGVEVDDCFRPVDPGRQVIYPNLFAVGAILAHQDWMRMKCGTGLSVATAFAAVNAFANRGRRDG